MLAASAIAYFSVYRVMEKRPNLDWEWENGRLLGRGHGVGLQLQRLGQEPPVAMVIVLDGSLGRIVYM